MSLQVKLYQASPVEAVQVAENNLEAVAEWCGGNLSDEDRAKGRIGVAVGSGWNTRLIYARIGSWVVKESTGTCRVFRNSGFERVFSEVPNEDLTDRINDSE